MSQDNPKVSVIIPVYNTEKYLRECLDSVVNQTLKDIEIICVDDGSTDSSPEILREYAAKDSRIKVYTQEKSNAGAARNNGLLHASGEYCIFLDADDFFVTYLLEKSYKKALADTSDIVAFHFYRYYEDGTTEKRTGIHKEWLTGKPTVFNYRDCPDYIMSIVNPTPWTKLYRTAFILDHNLKYEEISSTNDITFAAVSVAVAERISILDEHLVYYRVGQGGTITSTKRKTLGNTLIAVKSGVNQVSKLPYYDKIKNSATRFAVENIVFAFRRVITDFNDPVSRKFNGDVKAFYNTPLFNNCSESTLHSKTLYNYFRCIRDKDYLELVLMINGNAVSKKFVVDNLIVSLTSYPPRIATVHKTIETLLNQTIKPEKLILWLSDEEFPNREADLPEELLAQATRGLEIRWCNNIRSYKKLIPTLKAYPNAVIVTADDDVYYHLQWLERLYLAYIRNPDCIHVHRVTKFYLDDKGDFAIVKGGQDCWEQPSYLNKLVGVGGVLYPPYCFPPDVLDESKFMELAPTSDDIWFWLMAAMLGYKVNRVEEPLSKPNYVEGTQDVGLWHINDHSEKLFWVHFNNILQAYPQLERRLRSAWRETAIRNTVPVHSEKEVKVLKNRLSQKEQELKDIRSSISFKTGRTLTFIPRKLRGGVRCYRDHGAGYTLRRTLYHMGMWEDEENPDYNKRPLLKRFSDCCSEHSAPYTAWRVLVKLHMAKDGEEPTLIQRLEAESPAQKKPAKAAEPVKKDYAYYSSLPPEKYPEELKLWYRRVTNEELDLDNPQTYNEKIQWMKLYDSTPLKTRLADKYLVRAWVKQKIGGEYLIPLLGVWDSFDEIDFDKLPNQFVLKANHGSGWNIIVKDKSTFDKEEARKKFDVWMHTNFAFRAGLELHYMNIPPKIIAEEYMENLGSLYDYKVCCADGKPRFLWIDIDRYTDHRRVVYSLDWERLSFQINEKVLVDSRDYPKPECLEEMIGAAEILCKEFAQVRVDFYVVDGKLYFGEMTFTDASGGSRIVPREMEYEIGSWITLPPKKPIPMRLIYQEKRPEN